MPRRTMLKTAAATVMASLLASSRQAQAVDTPSPNSPIAKPDCDANTTVSIRYSSSSARLYLESGDGTTRGGCVTVRAIWEELGGKAPIYAVDPDSGAVSDSVTGTWLLTQSLYVEDGITLKVYGTAAGGFADELRLLSTNETYINLRAHGGSLDFVSTKVFAWDEYSNSVDENQDDGRSYISAISEIILDETETCDGRAKSTMGEARMDIEDSEMAYLGYYAGESYGLTWKVRGLCKDLSNVDMFDDVNVYGNIYDSDIHHNHFGMYTYGHERGDWRRNKMHDNTEYGFDPHDDSDLLTIHDNEVYNNGNHGIIASKRCNGVSIQGNEVYGGAEKSVGIFLHRSSDDGIVKGNYAHDNGDAGMAMMEVFDSVIYDNVFENNKYGIRMSVGCADNVIENNVVSNSEKYNVYTYEGSDSPWTVRSGRPQDNIITGNTMTGGREAIKLTVADGTEFIDNTFDGAKTVRFENSTWTVMSGNTGLDDVDLELKVTEGSCFDMSSDPLFTPTC